LNICKIFIFCPVFYVINIFLIDFDGKNFAFFTNPFRGANREPARTCADVGGAVTGTEPEVLGELRRPGRGWCSRLIRSRAPASRPRAEVASSTGNGDR